MFQVFYSFKVIFMLLRTTTVVAVIISHFQVQVLDQFMIFVSMLHASHDTVFEQSCKVLSKLFAVVPSKFYFLYMFLTFCWL